jgi:hypothetical protein
MDRRRIERDLAGVLNEMDNVRDNRTFVVGEIIFLSAVIAYYFQSWTALFVSVIVLAILFVIPYLRIVIFLFLSVIWGAIAYVILSLFLSSGLAIAGAIIIFMLLFFIHKGTA